MDTTKTEQPTGADINPWLRRGSALSILLAIAGTVTSGIAAAFGLVLGLLCWRKIRLGGGSHKDADSAIMGTAFSVIVLLAWLILPPFLAKARDSGQLAGCYTRAGAIGNALQMYVGDHDSAFPPGATWCDAIARPYVPSPSVFVCPKAPEARSGYALNKHVAGLRPETDVSDELILLFDGAGGWNSVGGAELFEARHRGVGILLRGDGHAEWMPEDQLAAAVWEP